jgi:hypothetical protein
MWSDEATNWGNEADYGGDLGLPGMGDVPSIVTHPSTLKAAARLGARSIGTPGGAKPVAKAFGPAVDFGLAAYGMSVPEPGQQEFDILNPRRTLAALDPRNRDYVDTTTAQGAGQAGHTAGALGGAALGSVAGPLGAAAGGYLGGEVGEEVGEKTRQSAMGYGDYWLRRPEFMGGLTDKEYERHLNDYRQQMDRTGPYRPKTRRAGVYAAPLEETNMKKNTNTNTNLLTESEMKRFQNLANIEKDKPMMSESLLAIAGVIGAFLAGTHLLGKAMAAHERSTGIPSQYTRHWTRAGEKLRARIKQGDPLLLNLIRQVREKTGKNILSVSEREVFAIVAEYKDDPNVADLIEALTYADTNKGFLSALEQLEEYVASKEAQQQPPEQIQQPPEEPQV